MARLTEGAETLVSSLAKAQAELEWVEQQLEEEFAKKCKEGREANPFSILQRINRLRRDLPAVQAECREVLAARQAVVDAAKRQLVGNTELLAQLQRRAGLQPEVQDQETLAAFNAAIAEHERGLTVQPAAPIDQEQLNQAFVHALV